VVLRRKGGTWRSAKNEGGGALYDYACHAIDLVNFIVGTPTSVGGVVRHSVFSRDVDDEVRGPRGPELVERGHAEHREKRAVRVENPAVAVRDVNPLAEIPDEAAQSLGVVEPGEPAGHDERAHPIRNGPGEINLPSKGPSS
jgi:predicted dehydrogenase